MKLVTLFFASLLSFAAHAGTSFEYSASAVEKIWINQQGQSPVGLYLEKEDDEVVTSVHFLEGAELKASVFGCHQHSADEFDCHTEDQQSLGAYSRSSSLYGFAEMRASLPLALDFVAKNVAPLESIRSVKLWEAFENIRYRVNYEKDGAVTSFFLACHWHGGEMDCHRKRDAGPGEPGSK